MNYSYSEIVCFKGSICCPTFCYGCRQLVLKNFFADVKVDKDVICGECLHEVGHGASLRVVGDGVVPGVRQSVAVSTEDT